MMMKQPSNYVVYIPTKKTSEVILDTYGGLTVIWGVDHLFLGCDTRISLTLNNQNCLIPGNQAKLLWKKSDSKVTWLVTFPLEEHYLAPYNSKPVKVAWKLEKQMHSTELPLLPSRVLQSCQHQFVWNGELLVSPTVALWSTAETDP